MADELYANPQNATNDTVRVPERVTPVDDKDINDGTHPAAESFNISSLPPADTGFHAWAYLGSAWVLDCFLWGLPFSYGVFLKYYSDTMKHSSLTLLTLVGTLSTGILYISSLLLLPLLNRYPHQKKRVMLVGYGLSVSGLVGAAFARNAGELILTQGILFSTGGSLLYFPMLTWLFEWFSAKRGLANGILFSGASAGGVFAPFVIEALLVKYGQKATLLSIAIFLSIFIAPCFLFLKPRLPVAKVVSSPQLNLQFLHSRVFWILFVANIIQGLGNFIPYLYLPIFASSLNLNSTYGTMGVALLNGASIAGMIFIGWLSDRNLRISMALSSAGAALAVFLLWGLSPSLPSYAVFASAYGFLGPSWGALYPRFATATAEDDPRLSSLLLSIFLAGRGLGNVLSAPISTSLNRPWALTGKTLFTYGLEGYGPLILFTGSTLFISSLGAAY
ncbi:MFS general substrate transporter [Gymnopus androsaceus JB14]|uniref:MFS general substrate transporter n=1 Tax=Gymnopus androsaceus JB14 TaxID=1447944 RepID=A0A6A4II80_9AGAR|nr:MFS general substrate transporter [Gymnopus androsaceus JB14]